MSSTFGMSKMFFLPILLLIVLSLSLPGSLGDTVKEYQKNTIPNELMFNAGTNPSRDIYTESTSSFSNHFTGSKHISLVDYDPNAKQLLGKSHPIMIRLGKDIAVLAKGNTITFICQTRTNFNAPIKTIDCGPLCRFTSFMLLHNSTSTKASDVNWCKITNCDKFENITPVLISQNLTDIIPFEISTKDTMLEIQQTLSPLKQFHANVPLKEILPSKNNVLLYSDLRSFPISVSNDTAIKLIHNTDGYWHYKT